MMYLGTQVLTTEPNGTFDTPEQVDRKFVILDSQTGAIDTDDLAPAPAGTRSLLWTAFSRAAIFELEAFLEDRRGRTLPFWIPTWQSDLSLASNLASGAAVATIDWVGYLADHFPNSGARRHLALYADGTIYPHKVSGAADPGTGVTETVTLSTVAERLFEKDKTLIMFLTLCRLEDDFIEFKWKNSRIAEAIIRFREIPLEAPL